MADETCLIEAIDRELRTNGYKTEIKRHNGMSCIHVSLSKSLVYIYQGAEDVGGNGCVELSVVTPNHVRYKDVLMTVDMCNPDAFDELHGSLKFLDNTFKAISDRFKLGDFCIGIYNNDSEYIRPYYNPYEDDPGDEDEDDPGY